MDSHVCSGIKKDDSWYPKLQVENGAAQSSSGHCISSWFCSQQLAQLRTRVWVLDLLFVCFLLLIGAHFTGTHVVHSGEQVLSSYRQYLINLSIWPLLTSSSCLGMLQLLLTRRTTSAKFTVPLCQQERGNKRDKGWYHQLCIFMSQIIRIFHQLVNFRFKCCILSSQASHHICEFLSLSLGHEKEKSLAIGSEFQALHIKLSFLCTCFRNLDLLADSRLDCFLLSRFSSLSFWQKSTQS